MPSFFCGIKIHSKILKRHIKKAETLSFFFADMFVMLFMSSSKCQKIRTFGVCKYFQPLVDKNIVHKKICHTVQHNTQSDKEHIVEILQRAKVHQGNGGQGKNHEKPIVFFQFAFVAVIVMISVQKPQKAMHHILVNNPSSSFHSDEYGYCDEYIYHWLKSFSKMP